MSPKVLAGGCLVALLLISPIWAAPIKLTLAGDSTVCNFPASDAGGRWGWGQALTNYGYFSTNVIVKNLAASGRSSKSFYDEGIWTTCLATHADYYFIQFGHNDGKVDDATRYTIPATTFKTYLNLYVTQARAAGGIPVFVTPPTRRSFSSEHKLSLDDLQNYAQAMREFGASNNVPVLDALPATIDFFEFIGKTKTPSYQADDTSTTTVTNDDRTHFNPQGARQVCFTEIECLLQSTNAALAPLKAEVRRRGIPVPLTITNNANVYFQGSFDLINWQAYGKTNVYLPSTVCRYLYNVGEPKAFYRVVAQPAP